MKTLRRTPPRADGERRGAALLLAFLVLIVIIAIVYQIYTVTQTDSRITRNELTRAKMDLALQAVMLQVYEDLAEDARAAQASESSGAAGADPGAITGDPAGGVAQGEAGEPERNPDAADSKMDGWYVPQSTNFDDIQIRIFIRDENSKYNVLNMLNEDEDVAAEAFRIVSAILDNAREGTDLDIGPAEAEELTTAMLEHMRDRRSSELPRPTLLTENTEEEDAALPLTFTEFRALDAFDDRMFEDLFGDDGERIHGIQSFLTVYTSPAVGPEEGGAGPPQGTGGFGVNVNTAPLAVLAALLDERTISYKVWDEILEYRNLEEDPLETEGEDGVEDVEPEPMLDEYGEEIAQYQIFDSLDELEEVFEYKALLPPEKAMVNQMLQTTSDVFEIILAARISTAADAQERLEFETRREQEEYFRSGEHLVRIARSVVWRRPTQDDIEMVPLIPWEIVDNAPLQILDYPEDDR